MKKLNYFAPFSIMLVAVAIMAFTFRGGENVYSVMSSSGAPAGYSGDPANGNKDCTNCHSGADAQSQDGWITADVPGTGYVPGETYTITATASEGGITRFGFQISPQNSGGTVLGTLVNTNTETKLVSGTNYVTQTSSGSTGGGSKTWTFDWTAPSAGSGDVTFYGAFNLADNNGGTSGDAIVLSTLSINEDATSGFSSRDATLPFTVYPNPAQDYLVIETADGFTVTGYTIFNQAGKKVLTGSVTGEITMLNINQLEAGMYFVRMDGAEERTAKFIKE
jgi:hypothetical protein